MTAAGFSPGDCELALSNALAGGHSVEAADLAAELTFGSAAQARAATRAYAELAAREPWSGWDPSDSSYMNWFDLARNKPDHAALWIDSGALKIAADDFWEFVAREPERFESEGSAPGLAAYCARSKARGQSPRPGEIAALGPLALRACAEGAASAGSWTLLRDMADSLREAFLDLDPKDAGLDPERGRLEALGLALAQGAAPFANAPFPCARRLGFAISLAEISLDAGVAFARAASDVRVDVKSLDGCWNQPLPGRMSDHAVDWTPPGDRRAIQLALAEIPSLSMPFSEAAAHWTSKRGRQVARAAGFSRSARSESIFGTLASLKGLAASPQRSALLERLALSSHTPEAAPARAPRL